MLVCSADYTTRSREYSLLYTCYLAVKCRNVGYRPYSKHRGYLEPRAAQMAYPTFRAAGWPMGSGIGESGNKVVVQRRLKGPGMRWTAAHVNPLLALRNGLCSDRWEETIA